MITHSARACVPRLVVRVPQTDGVAHLFRSLQRVRSTHPATTAFITTNRGSARSFLYPSTFRSYATEATKTKTPAKTTKKTTTAKKPAAKGAARKTTKKSAAKPKRKAKAKPKPKPKPKPRVKKVLTDKQKEEALKKKEKAYIQELKKTALSPPKSLPQTAYLVTCVETSKGQPGLLTKEAAEKYKAMSPEELERYNHIANQNRAANEEAYKKWVLTYTPDEIRSANNARRLLKRRLKTGKYPLIKDERQVKPALRAYILFTQERFNSGDLKNLTLPERSALLSKEWKGLSDGEKKRFLDEEAASLAAYYKAREAVYEHTRSPKVLNSPRAATAA